MADRKAVIKNADMAEDVQQEAIECATEALNKFNIEKDIAAYIKQEFDKSITQLGIVLLEEVLVHMLPMKPRILYIFT